MDNELDELFKDWIWTTKTAGIVVGEKPAYAIFKSDYPKFKQAIKALLATERRRVIREEMRAIDKANTDNGINFYTSDKKVNNGWKTMREYTKWRIKFAEKTKP